jgi:hypothetical protein
VLLTSCANTSRNVVACTGAYYVGAFISTTYISASYADPSIGITRVISPVLTPSESEAGEMPDA